ncbi:MAG: FCD domain-containing protein [Chloroflexota bacterium]|nr:MAG: FCD domain-containing protein [Chloroflexota bacterium]
MRVLVTGAAGKLGSNLTRRLREHGHEGATATSPLTTGRRTVPSSLRRVQWLDKDGCAAYSPVRRIITDDGWRSATDLGRGGIAVAMPPRVAPATGTGCRVALRLRGEPADGPALAADDGSEFGSPSGAPIITSLEFEHAILHLLDAKQGPVGSGSLMEQLEDLGFHVSEPTVGRFLRTLDRRGLTARISNKGRGLTEAGQERLAQFCEAESRVFYERELLRTIRGNTMEDILDVLVARRALERETARLAAERATPEDVERLEGAIREQRRLLETGGFAADADVKYHAFVAHAAHNRVLAAAIDLIRRDKQVTVLLEAMLRRTTHKWVVGHEKILDAIKRRAPDDAERAMIEHINVVIADAKRYHSRARSDG